VELLIALLGLTPAPTAAEIAGTYEIRQMEMAGGLELQSNGHFRYGLSYGAADESAEGDWTFDGTTVRLNSNPMPRSPDFVLLADSPAPACELSIGVDWGKLNWSSAPRVLVGYAGDPNRYMVDTDDAGKLEARRCDATSIRPLVPVYGSAGTEVKLMPGQGHRLSFRFEPNDIGQAAFRDEILSPYGQGLVMTRYETKIRFVRARP